MLKQKRRPQQGFGIIGTVIFLVIVGSVAFTGFYVSVTQNSQAEAEKAKPIVPISASTGSNIERELNDTEFGDLEIKEWDLKLMKVEATQKATYKIVTGGANYKEVAYLSTIDLDANGTCTQQYAAAGVSSYQYIVRYNLSDQVMIDTYRTPVSALIAATTDSPQARYYKLYGDKVFMYRTTPGTPCAEADGAKVERGFWTAFMDIAK